jgi:lysophospholipase L1-like esterase
MKIITADSFKNPQGIDLFLDKLSKGSYVGTAQDISTEIASILPDVRFLGEVNTSTVISGEVGNIYTIVTESGTYANWNSIVVPTNTFAILKRVDGNFSSSQTALDLTNYISKNNFADDYSTLNLIPNANIGLENTVFFDADQTVVANSTNLYVESKTGTPTQTVLKNTDGFNSLLRYNLKVGDRANIFSPITDTTSFLIDSTSYLNAGFFAKVPNTYTGSVTLNLRNAVTSTNFHENNLVEYVSLGNGWRFYRLNIGVLVNPAENKFNLGIYLNNTGGTTENITIAAPFIIRTKIKPNPSIFQGIETPYILPSNVIKSDNLPASIVTSDRLLGFNNNLVKDSLFLKQTVGATSISGSDWSVDTGGVSTFKGAYRFSNIETPLGNSSIELDIYKRSSDGFTSDLQPKASLLVPLEYRGKLSKMSFGFWMKRPNATIVINPYLVAFSDDLGYNLISQISYTPTIENEIYGNWVFVKVNNITLPTNTKYIRLDARVQWLSSVTTPLDTVYKVNLTGFVVNFLSPFVLSWNPNLNEKITEVAGDTSLALSGKKWTSYGDSITALGTWQANLLSKFTGISHYIRGIGGTAITETNSIAWVDANGLYLDRPPSAQPAGSFEILSSLSNQQRVNTIPTDSNIITIMGGTNDYGLPIGVITDTTVATFYGAFQLMLDRIYTRIPSAEIILVTPIFRNGGETLYNGFVMEDYRNAVRAISKKYNYRLIDMAKVGINKNNHATYLSDGIHPNTIGAERMSRLFIQEFKNIY